MKKKFQAKGPHKQAGAAILISDKVDFILKSIRRDNEGHFILTKGQLIRRKYQSLTYMYQSQRHSSTLKNTLNDLREQTYLKL
jgi:hypothetical protein